MALAQRPASVEGGKDDIALPIIIYKKPSTVRATAEPAGAGADKVKVNAIH